MYHFVHSGSRGGGSEEIQEETRFTNNTGAVQVAPEKQHSSYLTEEVAAAIERYSKCVSIVIDPQNTFDSMDLTPLLLLNRLSKCGIGGT